MKTLSIQTETANSLILNYKGELMTIDKDCDELLIGKKMYKLAALRRKCALTVPKSEIKLLEAPKVYEAKIIPSEPAKHLKALSRVNVKLLATQHPKFICSSKLLYKAIKNIYGVIQRKPCLPILEDICFILEKNKLTIYASNIERTLSETIEVESYHTGQITAPAKLLRDLLQCFEDCPLTFEFNTKDWQFCIYSENGFYKMSAHDADEFPKPKEVNSTPLLKEKEMDKMSEDELYAYYKNKFEEQPIKKHITGCANIEGFIRANVAEIETITENGFEFPAQLKRLKTLKRYIAAQKRILEQYLPTSAK